MSEEKEDPFVVIYHRRGGHYDEYFETLEEALHFIETQEDMGEIWAEKLLHHGVPMHPERGRFDPFPTIKPDQPPQN